MLLLYVAFFHVICVLICFHSWTCSWSLYLFLVLCIVWIWASPLWCLAAAVFFFVRWFIPRDACKRNQYHYSCISTDMPWLLTSVLFRESGRDHRSQLAIASDHNQWPHVSADGEPRSQVSFALILLLASHYTLAIAFAAPSRQRACEWRIPRSQWIGSSENIVILFIFVWTNKTLNAITCRWCLACVDLSQRSLALKFGGNKLVAFAGSKIIWFMINIEFKQHWSLIKPANGLIWHERLLLWMATWIARLSCRFCICEALQGQDTGELRFNNVLATWSSWRQAATIQICVPLVYHCFWVRSQWGSLTSLGL